MNIQTVTGRYDAQYQQDTPSGNADFDVVIYLLFDLSQSFFDIN
jgi:hypothetical protein